MLAQVGPKRGSGAVLKRSWRVFGRRWPSSSDLEAILGDLEAVLGRLRAKLGPKGQKSLSKLSRDIAGTLPGRTSLTTLVTVQNALLRSLRSRGGGLKTPAAIDRRPVCLALGRRLHAWIDASSHEWINACVSRDRGVFHRFVFILSNKGTSRKTRLIPVFALKTPICKTRRVSTNDVVFIDVDKHRKRNELGFDVLCN